MAKAKQHPEYEKAPMDRRTFIRRAVTAAAIGTGTGYLALAPSDWPLSLNDPTGLLSVPKVESFTLENDRYRVGKPSPSTPDVGVAFGKRDAAGEFTADALRAMLEKAIGAIGGIKHYIQPGDVVLIKPNVAFDRSPNLGATSNPDILQALIQMVLAEGGAKEVRVADNPIESPADCFMKSKIRQAAETAGARIYLPDSNAFRMLHTPGAKLIEHWWFFQRPFTNVNKVIGLAPIKDHNLCQASMGMKNWYGLLGGTRNQFHQNIHEIVSDLSLMIKPTFTVLDGTNVLMENGPTGGDPSNVKKGEKVLAGVDPVALDAWAFEHCLERGKDYPRYLYLAEEKGSGQIDWTGRVEEVVESG